jgi:hypothetical protein
MDYEDYRYVLTNREASREPRGGAFWCNACDGDLVPNGGRCRRCGCKSGGVRSKSGKVTPKA